MKNSDKIDSDTAETCTRQFREFEAAKQKEIDDRQKGKEADEQLQAEIKDYQRGKGAVPPGAKGNKGGGLLTLNLGSLQALAFHVL